MAIIQSEIVELSNWEVGGKQGTHHRVSEAYRNTCIPVGRKCSFIVKKEWVCLKREIYDPVAVKL